MNQTTIDFDSSQYALEIFISTIIPILIIPFVLLLFCGVCCCCVSKFNSVNDKSKHSNFSKKMSEKKKILNDL